MYFCCSLLPVWFLKASPWLFEVRTGLFFLCSGVTVSLLICFLSLIGSDEILFECPTTQTEIKLVQSNQLHYSCKCNSVKQVSDVSATISDNMKISAKDHLLDILLLLYTHTCSLQIQRSSVTFWKTCLFSFFQRVSREVWYHHVCNIKMKLEPRTG